MPPERRPRRRVRKRRGILPRFLIALVLVLVAGTVADFAGLTGMVDAAEQER